MLIDTIPHWEMFSWCNFHSAAYDSFDAKQKVRHCYGAARDRGSSAAEHCQPDAQPAQQSVPGGFSGHSSGAAGAGPSLGRQGRHFGAKFFPAAAAGQQYVRRRVSVRQPNAVSAGR